MVGEFMATYLLVYSLSSPIPFQGTGLLIYLLHRNSYGSKNVCKLLVIVNEPGSHAQAFQIKLNHLSYAQLLRMLGNGGVLARVTKDSEVLIAKPFAAR